MKKAMNRMAIAAMLALMLALVAVAAHDESDFAGAEKLIASNVSCSQLNDSQLGLIGDYYMEQLHPGAAHEYMDQMMGGEGSASLEQMHIAMAERFYCTSPEEAQNFSSAAFGPGMMGGNGFGMMGNGFGMMGYPYAGYQYATGSSGVRNMYGGYGMMGGYGFFGMSLLWLVFVAIAAFVFGIIFWWTYKLVAVENKEKKK
jgi:hypothetical protein